MKKYKKPVLLAWLFFATGGMSIAQPFYGWTADATSIAQSNIEIKATATTTDVKDNVYTTGYFRGTVDFDPGSGIANLSSNGNNYDVFITKTGKTGSLIWSKRIGSSSNLGDFAYSIAVDPDGNIHVGGSFTGTADFDPGSGVANLVSNGGTDIFVLQLDPDGNYLWAKSAGSTLDDELKSTAVDNSGNIVATGSFQNTADFDPGTGTAFLTSAGAADIFILKLNKQGNFIWAKSIGGISFSGETAYAVAADGDGNIYATGIFTGSIDFNPDAGVAFLNSAGGFDLFILKLDSNGTYIWAKNCGGTNNEAAYALAVDGYRNVYATGYFQGIADFDPGAGVANMAAAGSNDIFIVKLNVNGNYLWAKQTGSTATEYGYGIAVDGNGMGSVYTTGYFTGTVDFDPGSGVQNLTSNGGSDFFIQKLDYEGNFSWAYNTGGSTGDETAGIALGGNGSIYTCGLFRNNVNMDPLGGTDIKIANNVGVFTQKLIECGSFLIASHLDTSTLLSRNVSGHYLEFQQSCRTIARYQPAMVAPVQGNIRAKVWVEGVDIIDAEYLKRHYEITPANNAANSTGRITLYFTQGEFDVFNAVSVSDLPAGPGDLSGISNLVIEKMTGVSSDGSGLPSTYSGPSVIIDPADEDVVWNNTTNCWEVTFSVTGFSGFFVKSQIAVLPVRWLLVNGSLAAGGYPRINWQVHEDNVKKYIVEKSADNLVWSEFAVLQSRGTGENNYSYLSSEPLKDLTYFRIKQVGNTGYSTCSGIVKIAPSPVAQSITVSPNPVKSRLVISAPVGLNLTNSLVRVISTGGRIVMEEKVRSFPHYLSCEKLVNGIYYVQFDNGMVLPFLKE